MRYTQGRPVKFLILITLYLPLSFAGNWEHRIQVDPMTDIRSLFLTQTSDDSSILAVSFVQNRIIIQVQFPEEIAQDGMILVRWDKEKAYRIEVAHSDDKIIDIDVLDRISPFRNKSMIDKLATYKVLLLQYRNLEGEKIVVKFTLSGFRTLFNEHALQLYKDYLERSRLAKDSRQTVSPGQYAFARNGCAGCHSIIKNKHLAGPSLYRIRQRLNEQEIRTSITNPDAVIKKGYPAGLMPALIMSTKELNTIVKYIMEL